MNIPRQNCEIQVAKVPQGWDWNGFRGVSTMLKLSGRSKISLLVWLASKDHKSAGWRLVYCVMAVLTSQIALARLKIPWTHCSPIPETLWSPIPISCSIGIGMFVRACTNELWPHRVINSLPSHVCHYNTLATPTWNVTSAYHIGPLSSGPSCQMIRANPHLVPFGSM